MGKIIKLILILVLANAFWGSVSDAFTVSAVEHLVFANNSENADVQKNVDRHGSYVSVPRLPFISDAENSNSGGATQLLTFARVQHFYTTENILSLKGTVELMATREGALSMHREKLFDTHAFYPCSPVSQYYVYALRHIII